MITLVLGVLLAQTEKPHVALILAEAAPERLAKEGISLGRFYAAAPVGVPARAGLLTGAFPSRRRLNYNLQTPPGNRAYQQDDWLDPRGPFIARTFKEAGYATGHFGAWRLAHEKNRDAPAPSAYGFDEHDADAAKAVDFLRRRQAAPFFLVAGIAGLDALRDLGLEKRTFVVFVGETTEPGLRGQAFSLYDGVFRPPWGAGAPAPPAGARHDASVVGAVDLFPTLAALAGLKAPEGLDGEDRSGVLRGTSAPRAKPLFWEYGRGPNYQLPRRIHDRSPALAILEGNWKLLVEANGRAAELYDLGTDRAEETDVAARNAELVARLKAAALAWRTSLP